jgi:hypothetical protein
MQRHGQLGDSIEDQLSLAAVHYERGQVQVGSGRARCYSKGAARWCGCVQRRLLWQEQSGASSGGGGQTCALPLARPVRRPLTRACMPACLPLLPAQEATDIYKRLLLEHRDFLALNVFVALCYARLDYFDVSQVGAGAVGLGGGGWG